MNGNFSFDGETINDGDFNNFYEEFVSSKPTGTFTPPTSGGVQYSSPIGTYATKGESSPVTQPEKKGGFFKGIGDFIKSDTGRAVLTGVSQGIENQQGTGGGSNLEGAPDKKRDDEKTPMSTGAIIGISIGALAVVGAVIYFVTKK